MTRGGNKVTPVFKISVLLDTRLCTRIVLISAAITAAQIEPTTIADVMNTLCIVLSKLLHIVQCLNVGGGAGVADPENIILCVERVGIGSLCPH